MQKSVLVLFLMLSILGASECHMNSRKGKNWGWNKSKSYKPRKDAWLRGRNDRLWDFSNSDDSDSSEQDSFLDADDIFSKLRSYLGKGGNWWREPFHKGCRLVKCSSCDYGFAQCDIPGASVIRKAKLHREFSEGKCRMEESGFGVEKGKMWVNNGCSGVFLVCFKKDKRKKDSFSDEDSSDEGQQYLVDKKDNLKLKGEKNFGKMRKNWYVANTCEPGTTPTTETPTEEPSSPVTTQEPSTLPPTEATPCNKSNQYCLPSCISPMTVKSEHTCLYTSHICCEAPAVCAAPNFCLLSCPVGFSTVGGVCPDTSTSCCGVSVTCPDPPLSGDPCYKITLSEDGNTATYECANDASMTAEITCNGGLWPELQEGSLLCACD